MWRGLIGGDEYPPGGSQLADGSIILLDRCCASPPLGHGAVGAESHCGDCSAAGRRRTFFAPSLWAGREPIESLSEEGN
jgi:hypothetical protein